MEQIKKIDIHAHVTAFPQYAPDYADCPYHMVGPEELIDVFYDRIGIEKGVLLPAISPECRVDFRTNEATKWVTEQYPDRFCWFCSIDPRACENSADSNLTYLMEHYKKLGAKGVGELTANLYVDDPKMDNLFAQCAALKLPVTIHISPKFGYYGIVDDLGLPRLEKMLKKHPDLMILGHSQPFWSELGACTDEIRNGYPKGKVEEGRLPALLREYGNLYCDLSANSGANALMRDREYAARFIEEFADRIYYGCDICFVCNTHPFTLSDYLEDMRRTGEISEENYRKIVRENAVKLLGL